MLIRRAGGALAGIILLSMLAATNTSGLSRKPAEPPYVPGRIVIKFHEDTSSIRAAEIVESEGASIKTVLKRTRLHLVILPEGMSVEEAAGRFLRYPEVVSAEPDYRAERLEDQ